MFSIYTNLGTSKFSFLSIWSMKSSLFSFHIAFYFLYHDVSNALVCYWHDNIKCCTAWCQPYSKNVQFIDKTSCTHFCYFTIVFDCNSTKQNVLNEHNKICDTLAIIQQLLKRWQAFKNYKPLKYKNTIKLNFLFCWSLCFIKFYLNVTG